MNPSPTSSFDDLYRQLKERVIKQYDEILEIDWQARSPEIFFHQHCEKVRSTHAEIVGLGPKATWDDIYEARTLSMRWAIELGVKERWTIEQVSHAIDNQSTMERGLQFSNDSNASHEQASKDEFRALLIKECTHLGRNLRAGMIATNTPVDTNQSLDKILIELDKIGIGLIEELVAQKRLFIAVIYDCPIHDSEGVKRNLLEFLKDY